MADNNSPTEIQSSFDWSKFPFIKIFNGFALARRPGKLLLALMGIVILCFVGTILDFIFPGAMVMSSEIDGKIVISTELDIYTSLKSKEARNNFENYLLNVKEYNDGKILDLLMAAPFEDKNKPKNREEAEKWIKEGVVNAKVHDQYYEGFYYSIPLLKTQYDRTRGHIEKRFKKTNANQDLRKETLERLEEAYIGLFSALTRGDQTSDDRDIWVHRIIDTTDKEKAKNKDMLAHTMEWARIYHLSDSAKGHGIFRAFLKFKAWHLHQIATELVRGDFAMAKNQCHELLLGICWLFRFNFLYAMLLTLIGGAVWSIVGGAICRMTALQVARDERIGPMAALRFSMGKFASFFTAPLIPCMIIVAIALATWVVSLLAAIPYVGEIIAPALILMALLGGFIIALVTIGLIGGYNLMYPTIAVEGSDNFDAISRSFSYLFAQPWRMGFYSLIAFIYGAICYLFVRLFVFLMLTAVHTTVGSAVNIDASANISILGKLDAIWPAPEFFNLQPAINWWGLNYTETFAAGIVWIWIALTVAMILAFVVSFFFSINTTIYFLLRQRVDATELEDVFVEQDFEELTEEQPLTPTPEPPIDKAPAEAPTPPADPPTQHPPAPTIPLEHAEKPEDPAPKKKPDEPSE
ncbi:MAG: hypothetical protein K9M57_05455 [Phycisphaerae bacterium]|nr:hypothetical protein [Phycisphaerae bacterium]